MVEIVVGNEHMKKPPLLLVILPLMGMLLTIVMIILNNTLIASLIGFITVIIPLNSTKIHETKWDNNSIAIKVWKVFFIMSIIIFVIALIQNIYKFGFFR